MHTTTWRCGRPFLSAALALLCGATAAAQSDDESPLPGYFQWYKKTGDMVRIDPERARDQLIDSGRLTPLELDVPLPDLSLPDASGEPVRLRGWVGDKRLVIPVFRTWW